MDRDDAGRGLVRDEEPLSRVWAEWRSVLRILKPETVLAWHRKAFRKFWIWKVRRGRPGRPTVSADIRALIRRITGENPGWGAPRIHGELLKLGIDMYESLDELFVEPSRLHAIIAKWR